MKDSKVPRYFDRRKQYHSEVKRRYLKEKESTRAIAAALGISRKVVRSCLKDMNIKPRNLNSLPDQDELLFETKLVRAKTIQKHKLGIGRFEEDVAKYLVNKGLQVVHQYAWNQYNIDLYLPEHRTAIEVYTGCRPGSQKSSAQKIMELLMQDIDVVCLWITKKHFRCGPDPLMYKNLFEAIRLNKPDNRLLGQYTVLRGTGEDATASCQMYLNRFVDVAIQYNLLTTARIAA